MITRSEMFCAGLRLKGMSADPSGAILPPVLGNGPLPKGRPFYGAISGQLRGRDLTFAELRHPFERLIPNHTHETSYYDLVLGGGYEECSRQGTVLRQPFSSAFNSCGTEHGGRVAPSGARFFTVEIGNAWIHDLRQVKHKLDTVHDGAGGELTFLGCRLYREYRAGSLACALTIDALIWELFGVAARITNSDTDTTPTWWTRAEEFLHSEFRRNVRISEVAREVGVHPVHLARVFRRVCHETPGEYVQRLRVRFVAEKLSLTDVTISTLAAEAGFADQSHLTRVFRRYTAMTPDKFRKALK
jgi:AraC family transcriptional regulator